MTDDLRERVENVRFNNTCCHQHEVDERPCEHCSTTHKVIDEILALLEQPEPVAKEVTGVVKGVQEDLRAKGLCGVVFDDDRGEQMCIRESPCEVHDEIGPCPKEGCEAPDGECEQDIYGFRGWFFCPWMKENVEALRPPVTTEPEKCRIYEYDGAFKCMTHNRTWGAIADPDEPCKEVGPKAGGGWHRAEPDPPDIAAEQRAEPEGEDFASSLTTTPDECPACHGDGAYCSLCQPEGERIEVNLAADNGRVYVGCDDAYRSRIYLAAKNQTSATLVLPTDTGEQE